MSNVSSSYHNFSDFSALRKQAAESPDKAIEPVARKFESVFLQMMLKSMRESVSEGGLLNSEAMKTYQGMFDEQLSLTLSEKGGIGIADAIMRQMTPQANALKANLDKQSNS